MTRATAQNFKSRGQNTIFAFNWVDEDYAYSIEQASNGTLNTLWLGNVVAKRTTEGLWQGRVFAIGDGSGVVHGTVVAVNNTFVTFFPRDHFVFSFPSGDANLVLVNNVFAGPAEVFAYHNGKGTITGTNNWIRKGVKAVPEGLENTVYGDDPGFVDYSGVRLPACRRFAAYRRGRVRGEVRRGHRHRPRQRRVRHRPQPSAPYLKALEDVKAALPKYEPIRKGHGFEERETKGTVDIGAYEK